MIERIKKVIGVAALLVFGAAVTGSPCTRAGGSDPRNTVKKRTGTERAPGKSLVRVTATVRVK